MTAQFLLLSRRGMHLGTGILTVMARMPEMGNSALNSADTGETHTCLAQFQLLIENTKHN